MEKPTNKERGTRRPENKETARRGVPAQRRDYRTSDSGGIDFPTPVIDSGSSDSGSSSSDGGGCQD